MPMSGQSRPEAAPPGLPERVGKALALPLAAVGGVGLLVLIGLASPPRGVQPSAPSAPAVAPTATADASLLYTDPRPAPPVELTASDGSHFSLAGHRGTMQLVFFGYTHCPDVCPLTVGTVGDAIARSASPVQAVFVTVDPARDTTAWLADYARYTPPGFAFVTGSDEQISQTAAAWNVRYARVDTAKPGEYEMTHTADVYVVDAAGMLRAHFPFGTDATAMAATIAQIGASGAAGASSSSAAPSVWSAPPTAASVEDLDVAVVSSSVWAGGDSPLILTIADGSGRIDDPAAKVTLQLLKPDGLVAPDVIDALPVAPPGETKVFYVAGVDIAATGPTSFAVVARTNGSTLAGSVTLTALDPGTTAGLGGPAPTIHTPTLADVGGDASTISTDPQPDPRLYSTSTTDALAEHRPFVLVIDSYRFRVTSACGKALGMATYLLDRWTDVPFIHLEPFGYSIVSDTPVINGSLAEPTEVDSAAAWGVAEQPWGPLTMPWVFIVDQAGIVRAKYQGVMGTDDIDVIVSMLTNR
jgi:protein SCO1